MLNHHQRIAAGHDQIKQTEQVFNVGHMQSGGGLIHHNNTPLSAQVLRQLDSLALPSGQGAEGLAKGQIA